MNRATLDGASCNINLLYCNGIEATTTQAEEQAAMISGAFKGSKVTLFHNPTMLQGYVQRDSSEEVRQADLATDLANKIRDILLEKGTLLLFAHSHGAFLVKNALLRLDAKERQQINVFTFGGVAMIRNSLAGKVHNFVFEQDLIAQTGSKKYDPDGILNRVIQITKKMRTEALSEEEAIRLQSAEDAYLSLDPIMVSFSESDPAAQADKSRRFGQGFLGGDTTVFKDADVELMLQKYTSCFTEYRIEVLSRPLQQKKLDARMDPKSLCQAAKQDMGAYGQHSLNCHILTAFTGVIKQIAERELAALKTNKSKELLV